MNDENQILSGSPSIKMAWFVVAQLWLVSLLNYLDRVMITTMRESLMDAIPMTDAQFGLLTSAFLWVYAVLSPFAGFMADRFSRSRVVIISLLVWSAITWLTGHAKTFEQLIAARALMGISEACYIPAALALIADYHRGSTRSLATGIQESGIFAGAGLGGLGGWIAERHGWSLPFNIFGIFGVGYSVLLLLTLKDAPRDTAQDVSASVVQPPKVGFGKAIVSLFSRGSFLLILTFWGLLGIAGWALLAWMPTYIQEHFQLSQGKAGLSATGYMQTAALVGVLIGGAWADRWSRTSERGRILVPVIGLGVAAPAVLLAANTDVFVVFVAGLVIYGLARAFTDSNMMPILCLVADPRYRATGFGILNCFACVIGGVAIYAGGALRDANVNLKHVFQFAAFSLVVCAVLLFLVKPSRNVATKL
jgi:MFS family permease